MTTASSADHPTRRDFLFVATGAVAAVGAAATVWPLVSQMNPDASTIAAGAPIEVDLAPIAEGQDIKVFWRGKPIYISHRTKKQIDEARKVPVALENVGLVALVYAALWARRRFYPAETADPSGRT